MTDKVSSTKVDTMKKLISSYKQSKYETPILRDKGVLYTYNIKTKIVTEYYPDSSVEGQHI
jgi:hypothetical protein